jgi:hypothetical protein
MKSTIKKWQLRCQIFDKKEMKVTTFLLSKHFAMSIKLCTQIKV